MANSFKILGGKPLRGAVEVRGSKNAATPILAAALLTSEPCRITNVPQVTDVESMAQILARFGARVAWQSPDTLVVEAKNIEPKIDEETRVMMRRMRSSVLFFGPLLARFGRARLPYPGGCEIGSRSIEAHLSVFRDLGYEVLEEKKWVQIERGVQDVLQHLILPEFSVTATENALIALARTESRVGLHIAAAEPHVQDLCRFLSSMGVSIENIGSHDLFIAGSSNLQGAEHKVVGDYIEAGTFIAAALATRGDVLISGISPSDLRLTLKLLRNAGANIEEGEDWIHVRPSPGLVLERVQTMPHPGIPTDLQAFFSVLAAKTKGVTLIHDPLYEGRLGILEELKKMGVRATLLDPHRAHIEGPAELKGAEIQGTNLREAAALIIAGLAAEGQTIVRGAEHVDRGYDKIDERLRSLGADIIRV